jgi:hypothetical protein
MKVAVCRNPKLFDENREFPSRINKPNLKWIKEKLRQVAELFFHN